MADGFGRFETDHSTKKRERVVQAVFEDRPERTEHSPHLTVVGSERSANGETERESDGGLVRAAARDDVLAWSTLVRRFDGLVRAIARSHRLNEADVADVSQVVWLRLATHVNRLHEPDRVAGWLVTTTRRECLLVLRQGTRVSPMSDMDVLDRLDGGGEPPTAPAGEERAVALRSMIRTLPGHQQRLLEMLLRDPRPSYKEISEALKIPVGSIGPTRQRCLAVLRSKCISAGIQPVPA